MKNEYWDFDGKIINIGDRLYISPGFYGGEKAYFKVINNNEIKWERQNPMNTNLKRLFTMYNIYRD